MPATHHPIAVVSRRTGLSPHVIRVWERRYGIVAPQRTATNRRLYSDQDIERLTLLRRHTEAGQSIGYLAGMSNEQLATLTAPITPPSTSDSATGDLVDRALTATKDLDAAAIQAAFVAAEIRLGVQGMLVRVAAPFAQMVGERWREGVGTAAQEHFATASLRRVLDRSIRPFAPSEHGPVIVVGTPPGQLHEIGALLVAAQASNLGWRVVYLGAGLPLAEIAGAACQHHARALALSIVYPEDDPQLADELGRLPTVLPPGIAVIAGGRSAVRYTNVLAQIGATVTGDLLEFGKLLDQLRSTP